MTARPPKPDWQSPDGRVQLYCANCLDVLPLLPTAFADAVITDPPYSSGGFTRSDRARDPVDKYVHSGVEMIRASFSGDNRDGRSWCYWCAVWLSECFRCIRESGYGLVFSDWRQLPLATDAIQAGGFVWRGLIAWDKGDGARAPHTGYWRHQCEYVVWGTVGVSRPAAHGGPWPGCIRTPVVLSDKHHLTGKPTRLISKLIEAIRPDGLIVDPFIGSGTTAVACLASGRRCIGVELDRANFATSVARCERALLRGEDFIPGLDATPKLGQVVPES